MATPTLTLPPQGGGNKSLRRQGALDIFNRKMKIT
jgi:hypothetical protein